MAAFAIGFGYAGYNLTRWEDQMLEDVNRDLVKRKMTPLTREKLVPSLADFKEQWSKNNENSDSH